MFDFPSLFGPRRTENPESGTLLAAVIDRKSLIVTETSRIYPSCQIEECEAGFWSHIPTILPTRLKMGPASFFCFGRRNGSFIELRAA